MSEQNQQIQGEQRIGKQSIPIAKPWLGEAEAERQQSDLYCQVGLLKDPRSQHLRKNLLTMLVLTKLVPYPIAPQHYT